MNHPQNKDWMTMFITRNIKMVALHDIGMVFMLNIELCRNQKIRQLCSSHEKAYNFLLEYPNIRKF